jgi:hypothetical protein
MKRCNRVQYTYIPNAFLTIYLNSSAMKYRAFTADINILGRDQFYLPSKIRAFWDIEPCSFGLDRLFRGAYCLHHQGFTLIMEAVRTCEMSVYPNETKRRDVPEGSNIHSLRRENLKYHICLSLNKYHIKMADTECFRIWIRWNFSYVE